MTTTTLLESPESGSAAGETAGRLRLVHQDRSVINASGLSVDTAGVEEALNRHPNVDRAAVIGGPDSGTGEAMKAFIVLTEDGSAEQVLGSLRDSTTGMTGYRVPKYIEFRRSLPLD